MTKFYLLIAYLLMLQIAQAQTTIDEIENGSYIQLGILVNSRMVFAGQSLGITGAGFLPNLMYQHKSGFYASVTPTIYSNPNISKKSTIADADFNFGYIYSSQTFTTNNSFSHDQVYFGNKFFKTYLANSFSTENRFDITENLAISADGMLLFSKQKKWNIAPILHTNVEYSFYLEEVLGAEQLKISPSFSYYYGSDKLSATFTGRDSLTETNKKVTSTNHINTLSIIPQCELNWQKKHHEISFILQLPFAYMPDAVNATKNSYQITQPIFSLQYDYYLGFGRKE